MNQITTAIKTHPLRETLEVKSANEAVSFLNLLIYGEPGAGKTYLAGTSDDSKETSPVLLIDVEGGTLTLRRKPNIDVKSVRTMDDIVRIHAAILENPGYYKTVVLDSVTELQKLDMQEIMREVMRSGKRPDQDPDTPAQRDWGKSSTRIRRIIRGFRDLECNTIMTALVAMEKDTQTNALTYYPSLPGKLKTEVAGFMDIVGYLYTDVDEDGNRIRKIQFAQTRRVIAKDRTASLGDIMLNPSIPEMNKLIHTKES